MANTPVINLRRGQAVRYNNDVCVITATELKTPPRMASYVQMSIRSIANGNVKNLRMTSNESLDLVNMDRQMHEFSYTDGDGYHFIHPTTFEDALVGEDLVADVKKYLVEGLSYNLLFTDDVIAAVEVPPSIALTVSEASEGVKGDSANNVYKAVTLETGLVVQVPLFINQGDKVNIKTEDATYLSRA